MLAPLRLLASVAGGPGRLLWRLLPSPSPPHAAIRSLPPCKILFWLALARLITRLSTPTPSSGARSPLPSRKGERLSTSTMPKSGRRRRLLSRGRGGGEDSLGAGERLDPTLPTAQPLVSNLESSLTFSSAARTSERRGGAGSRRQRGVCPGETKGDRESGTGRLTVKGWWWRGVECLWKGDRARLGEGRRRP